MNRENSSHARTNKAQKNTGSSRTQRVSLEITPKNIRDIADLFHHKKFLILLDLSSVYTIPYSTCYIFTKLPRIRRSEVLTGCHFILTLSMLHRYISILRSLRLGTVRRIFSHKQKMKNNRLALGDTAEGDEKLIKK